MNPDSSGTATLAPERELTRQDLDQGLLYLQQTRSGLLGAIQGLSERQWAHTPSVESWSIGQIVEHVVFVLDRVSGPVRQAISEAPETTDWRDNRLIDGIIISQFPCRLAKFPAPAASHPSGRFQSQGEAVTAISAAYACLTDFLTSTPDLRERVLESAPLKAATNGMHTLMDGYQWILAAAAHTERHTKQILEVRADESFPAR